MMAIDIVEGRIQSLPPLAVDRSGDSSFFPMQFRL